MVRVPTPAGQGAQNLGTVQPEAARAPAVPDLVSGVAAAWRPWIQLAGGAAELGGVLQRQDNERNLLEIEQEYARFERESMFGEGGWASQTGENAFGLADRAEQDIDAFSSKLFSERSLNGATRKAAEQWITGQKNAALQKVANQEFTQRESHIIKQMAAGVDLAIENAGSYWNNPRELARQEGLALQRHDAFLRRQGIDPDSDLGKAEELKMLTRLTETTYNNILAERPDRALAYLNQAEAAGSIDSARAGVLRAQVTDDAKRFAGKNYGSQLASLVLNATPVSDKSASTQTSYFFGTGPDNFGPLIQRESGGSTTAVSPAGARGMSQVMPANLETNTSLGFGVVVDVAKYNAGDPQTQWQAGRDYFEALLTHPKSPSRGNVALTLMSYNWGPGNVQELLAGRKSWDDVPQETVDYVNALLPDNMSFPAQPANQEAEEQALAVADIEPVQNLSVVDALRQAMTIADPIARDAAVSELLQVTRAFQAAQDQAKSDMVNEAYAFIDGGGTLNDYLRQNPGARDLLGSSLPALRQWDSTSVEQRQGPASEGGVMLFQNMRANPEDFVAWDDGRFASVFKPMLGSEYPAYRQQWIDLKIQKQAADAETMATLGDNVTKAAHGAGPWGVSDGDAQKIVDNAWEGSGRGKLKANDAAGHAAQARAKQVLLLEAAAYAEKNGQRMPPLEQMRVIQRELLNTIEIERTKVWGDISEGTVDDIGQLADDMRKGLVAPDEIEFVEIPKLDPVTGLPLLSRDGDPIVVRMTGAELQALLVRMDRKLTPRELANLLLELTAGF